MKYRMQLNKRFFSSKLLIVTLFVVMLESSCNHNRAGGAGPSTSANWTSFLNLTPVIDGAGVTELSGLYWNDVKQQLFAVSDEGQLFILQYDSKTDKFALADQIKKVGNPEGITQVTPESNEFYTIDEKHFEIRSYMYEPGMRKATQNHKWNLLSEAGGMMDTGNDGPEGIAFVSDKYLKKAGFLQAETEEPYTSRLGMGGLLFVAHQKKGMIWVYDVNPQKDDELVLVGKYKTSQKESCDLSFDASKGLLYILHNCDGNSLEVTDLSVVKHGGKEKFRSLMEYPVPNDAGGSDNIEGVAIVPAIRKDGKNQVFFCKDIPQDGSAEEQQNCLASYLFVVDK